jgi:integrase
MKGVEWMRSQRPLTGSIQTKNFTYYAVINEYVNGSRKQDWVNTGYKTNTPSKRKAQEFLQNELFRRMEARKRPSHLKDASSDMPFVDFMELWLKMKKKVVTVNTYQGYELIVDGRIKTFFTERKTSLSNLSPRTIEEFYESMQDEELSGNSILHYHRVIKQALSYAVKKDILLYNIMDKVDAPRKGSHVADYYTPREALQLLEVFKDDPIYIPVLIAVYYGARRSEVLGLRWRSIDFEENRIVFEHKVLSEKVDGEYFVNGYDVMKTTASRRSMPLIPRVAEELKKEKARQAEHQKLFKSEYSKDKSGYVCVDALGKILRPSYVSSHFNLILKEKGLRHIRLHDLRHSCASMLAAAGVPMKQIQLWLGHSNYSTTADIYTHLDYKAQEQSAQAIQQILG